MADDLGWGDTGYNGSEIIKTPFLDQMAGDRSESADIIGEYPHEAAFMIEELTAWFESCRKSFEGAEYGRESYNRLEQTWPGTEF